MYLFSIGTSDSNTAVRELPTAGRIDPEPNNYVFPRGGFFSFEITYEDNNTTVTFTKTFDERGEVGWGLILGRRELNFRVYELDEVIPRFDTTMYTYMGVQGEYAPTRTTLATIHRSTNIIRDFAFWGCHDLQLCLIHDNVETIGEDAFAQCRAMNVIRLPKKLRSIGTRAFEDCSSLRSLFIPSGVNYIGHDALGEARGIRVVSFPPNIRPEQFGDRVMEGCEVFFQVTEIQGYHFDPEEDDVVNSPEVHQSILNFYRNDVTRLHRVCLKTDVTAGEIHRVVSDDGEATLLVTDHNGMTPLHILAMNPYAPPECIAAYMWLEPDAALMLDALENTPLDYLITNAETCIGDNKDALVALIEALIMRQRNATARNICCWPFSRRSE